MTCLRLWAGDQDITGMFVVDEQRGSSGYLIRGPVELLTAYTANEDLSAVKEIDEDIRDEARRAAEQGVTFLLDVPGYYEHYWLPD